MKSLAAFNNVVLKYKTVCAYYLNSLQPSLRHAQSNVITTFCSLKRIVHPKMKSLSLVVQP